LCLEADTPIIAKTQLKTLKKWAEEMFDVDGAVNVADFMIKGRNMAQQDAQARKYQNNPKRNASVAGRNTGGDDGTVKTTTIGTV
jgi:hypothetical protein